MYKRTNVLDSVLEKLLMLERVSCEDTPVDGPLTDNLEHDRGGSNN